MKILNFTSFINEILFSYHWKERSAEEDERGGIEWKKESRILPANKSENGWEIQSLVDTGGQRLNANNYFKTVDKEENFILSSISDALREITRSGRLVNYSPGNQKKYLFLNLGVVCLWNGQREVKINFSSKNGKYSGDTLYGISVWEPSSQQYRGITFLFQNSTIEGESKLVENFYSHLSREKKIEVDEKDFLKNYDFRSPYGLSFKCVIDLTKDKKIIEEEIKSQVAGTAWINPKESEKLYKIAQKSYEGQFTLKPGMQISIRVPYINPYDWTPVEIKEIQDLKKIEAEMKRRYLESINEIKFSFSPVDKNQKKFVDEKEVYGVATLREKMQFLDDEGRKFTIQLKRSSIVVSDIRIIARKSVAIWVKEI
jgi:hypothetical protein